MDKKEIYEHLAKIYLDASSKSRKKKKTKVSSGLFRNLFFLSLTVVLALGLVLFNTFTKRRNFNSEVALVLAPDALKINFNFDPAKKEIYALSLNKLDLSRYHALGFSVKRQNFQDSISLRVEFINAFKEKSEVYIRDIPHKWKDYKINLSTFKRISDWTEMIVLSFGVEEWNAKFKKGLVYIDNVRLLK
jgi:hypothetical protein